MQFKVIALTLAAMASVASAHEHSTVTVYACPTSSTAVASPTYVASTGFASPTVASTGGVPPVPTSSPIVPVTGGASVKGVSALGMIIAGGVALFL